MSDSSQFASHYGGTGLVERLDTALTRAGFGDKRPSPVDLAPLDQFHVRGLAATTELSQLAAIRSHDRVIDIGSGLGGPSRYLAFHYGCEVIGVDLSPYFVEAAEFLGKRSGMDDKVSYQCADALALPFENQRFDLAWTQHTAMNIADRPRLYTEVHRVLRSGGRFAIYDVVAGDDGPVIFPVPWSRSAETSFLLSPIVMRATLEQAGFQVTARLTQSEAALAWFDQQRNARPQAASSASILGLNLAMGPEFSAMAANFERNLRDGRVGLVQAVLKRP
jgi:ubiquinone/menaquinone biosynthesis C-methylase UbiE